MSTTVEICCGSYEDALQAQAGRAGRIELNSALAMGGLTPSAATLELVKEHTDLEVIAMVRPRGAGFCYSQEEFEVMKLDCLRLLEGGADGIAFGCLQPNGEIHRLQTRVLIDLIRERGGQAVFHRAFDCCPDPIRAIETLISLGADRILTSGQKPKAMDGAPLLRRLCSSYGEQIQLLAGSGVNASNAARLIRETGLTQVHSSCKDWKEDPTTVSGGISFSFTQEPSPLAYDTVSARLVRELIESVKQP